MGNEVGVTVGSEVVGAWLGDVEGKSDEDGFWVSVGTCEGEGDGAGDSVGAGLSVGGQRIGECSARVDRVHCSTTNNPRREIKDIISNG